MSKILVKDLKELAKLVDEIQIIDFKGFPIQVKNYLSITEKIGLVSSIYNSAIDEDDELQIVNYNALDIARVVLVTKSYTDINLPKDNIIAYDLLVSSGLYNVVYQSIPQGETKELEEVLRNYEVEKNKRYERENTLPNIVKNLLSGLVDKLPSLDEANKFIEDASKEIEGFDPNKMQFVKDFLAKTSGEV